MAIKGTMNMNTLALIGPIRDIEYIYTDVPKDIAPIETKNKLIRNNSSVKIEKLKSFISIKNTEIIDVNK